MLNQKKEEYDISDLPPNYAWYVVWSGGVLQDKRQELRLRNSGIKELRNWKTNSHKGAPARPAGGEDKTLRLKAKIMIEGFPPNKLADREEFKYWGIKELRS